MSYQRDVGLIEIVIGENSKAHEALKRICAQHEVLITAAKLFLGGYPFATKDNTDPNCNCYNCQCERAAVDLRAAGIQIDGERRQSTKRCSAARRL